MVGSLKKNTTLEYSTRVVQEGDRRCEKSTLKDLAYLTPLRTPLMNPVRVFPLDKRQREVRHREAARGLTQKNFGTERSIFVCCTEDIYKFVSWSYLFPASG